MTKKDLATTNISLAEIGIDVSSFKEVTSDEFARNVRSLMQGSRQGTVGCKDRSEVNKTNKKPWRQKGTGRARAGSARSPLWRGGGVVFGPQPRVRRLKVNSELKSKALLSAVINKINNNLVYSIDFSLNDDKPKTKLAYAALKNAGIDNDKLILIVRPDDFLTQYSFFNLKNVSLVSFDSVNLVDLSSHSKVVVLKNDINEFKRMVEKWI